MALESASKPKKKSDRFFQWFRVFVTHLISQVGLTLLVVTYSIGGAFMFQHLESHQEIRQRGEVSKIRLQTLHKMWNVTLKMNVLDEENWMKEIGLNLKRFEDIVVTAVKKNGYDGKDVDESLQWSFSGALLYCITVITTIGYGNIAPKTQTGKIGTIMYAIVGIPLMLMCLSNIGFVLAQTFKFVYGKAHCRKVKTNNTLCHDTVIKLQDNHIKTALKSYESNEHPSSSTILQSSGTYMRSKNQKHSERIPVYLVLLFVTLYICLGAMLFSLWEGWSFLNGAYFCFITLSTIGFGDYVPGTGLFNTKDSPSDGQAQLIICCVYLVLGLAIIAMSFNLLQEEVILKCKDIAKKIRLVTNQDAIHNV